MKAAITLPPHDPEYVERRGGVELLSHLRGAPSRVAYRQRAIQRAYDRFAAAEDNAHDDSEIGGLGLIVLQRALLAVEDLGGLLHAFGGSEPWIRLRSTTIPEIDAAFELCRADPAQTLEESCRLATEPEIEATDLGRWLGMLHTAANLWTGSPIAKATMHGFPIVSGKELLGPPPAGAIARGVTVPHDRRFAVALISASANSTEVQTLQLPVPLDRDSVNRYRRDGSASGQLYGELCAVHATSTLNGFRALVPWDLLHDLSKDDREALQEITSSLGGPK